MKWWLASGLLLVLAGVAHADVYLLDSDTLAAATQSRTASISHAIKPGDKPGIPLSQVNPRPAATGSAALVDQSGLQYFINTDITSSTSSSASGAMSEASYTQAVAATTSAGGTTMSTLSDAFDGYGTLCVSLTGATGTCATGNSDYTIYYNNGPATNECSGRQIVFPAQTIGGLSVSRKIYIPTDDAFARSLDSFTNTSAAPVTFNAITANNLGSDDNTVVVATSSGDAVADPSDTWVTSFQSYSGNTSSDPRLGHVLRGPGAPVGLAALNFVTGNDTPYWAYTLTLAPGQTAALMRFVTGQPSKTAAATQAARLATVPATAVECMTPTEQSQVVNFLVVPDLSITKTAPATVNAGAAFDYTINVSNAGAAATNATITDTLPAGVAFVSASGTGWTCGASAGVVTCTQASLPTGPASAITISVTAPTTPGSISNTAVASDDNGDANATDNTSTVTTLVASPALVTGTKTVSGATTVGGSGTYTVTLNNAGPSDQLDNAGNEFTDVLPANLALVSASASSGTEVATVGTNTVTWNGAIPASGSVTITIAFTITSGVAGDVVSNQGSIAYDADGNGSNEASGVTDDPSVGGAADPTSFTITTVTPPVADVGITMSGPAGSIAPSSSATFTSVVSNSGPAVADLSATFTFPAGFTVQSIGGAGLTCTPTGNTATCTSASFAVGSSTVSMNVAVPATAGSYSASAVVTTSDTDPNPANNAASAPLVVGGGVAATPVTVPSLGLFGLLLLSGLLALTSLLLWRRRAPAA